MLENYLAKLIDLFGAPIQDFGEEVKFVCPECSKKALFCNINKGLCHCFVCDYSTFVKLDNVITVPEVEIDPKLQLKVTQKIVDLFTLDSTHREYLKKRGIFNPEKYKLSTVPFQAHKILSQYFTNEELLKSGYCVMREQLQPRSVLNCRRIIIPYWNKDKILTLKSRINPFEIEEDFKPRFASPKHSQVGSLVWYQNIKDEVIITEGELKAIGAIEAGYCAVGLSGINPAPKALDKLKRILKDCSKIYIIFDTDPELETNLQVIESAVKIQSMFLKRSVITFLPIGENQKVDLDSYLVNNELEDFDYFLADSWKNKDRLNEKWKTILGNLKNHGIKKNPLPNGQQDCKKIK